MTRSLDEIREALASRYRVERELGSGASATVYLAHDLRLDREVAVKVLNPDLAQATGGQRFLREIQVAASLQHPNLVAILDSGELGGVVFYVTPHMAGGSLRDLLRRERQLSIRDAVHFTRELASALGYIHAHGIVHRDVKPENILLEGQHACLADFGIARALDRVAGETITSTGLVVGTPAYMSPEQASGERAVDARSDQYSLACVTYEMIAGVPPFIGATAQAVIAQRFAHDALPLSHYRKSVPPHVESAVARALELNPADRYPSVERLAASLADATLASTAETWGVRTSRAVQRRWFTIGAATALVILAVLGFTQAYPHVQAAFGPALDTTRFVVLPFDGTASPGLPGSRVADAAYMALREWEDLPLIPDVQVRDAIGAQRTSINSLGEATATAASFSAGRLVWGRVLPSNGRFTVTGDLYDVGTKRSLRDASVAVASADSLPQKMAELINALLRLPELRRAPEGELGTRSFTARREFERGEIAYANGDFAAALQHYRSAAAADQEFARADLRIGLVGMLTGVPVEQWQQQARRAAAARESFSARGAAFAAALAALADGRYPDACSSFDAARRVDSLDFAAWYGLGECRFLDSLVVPSQALASGYAFRSSFNAAAESYLRAAALDDRAYATRLHDRLRGVLKIETSQIRRQYDDARRVFTAFPRIAGDTLAFVPYPVSGGVDPRSYPPRAAHESAIGRGAARLLEFAQRWAERQPQSADAHEALADVLEVGHGRAPDRHGKALSAARRARGLTPDPARRVSLAAREVRLLLKRGEFGAAKRLADSVISSARSDDIRQTARALAALTGRVALVARLGQEPQGVNAEELRIPPELAATAAVLETYAAMGVCQKVEAARNGVLQGVDAYVPADRVQAVTSILLNRAGRLATPCTGGRSALWSDLGRAGLDRAQRVFAEGANARAIAILDSLARTDERARQRPGEVGLDVTFQESWLRAAAGDTAGAVRLLDRVLGSLPAHRTTLLHWPAEAAALPRAMILRAELAAAAGDREAARHWAGNALTLWSDADPDLRSTVSRLRQLAAP